MQILKEVPEGYFAHVYCDNAARHTTKVHGFNNLQAVDYVSRWLLWSFVVISLMLNCSDRLYR